MSSTNSTSLYDAARDSGNIADIWDDTELIEHYERQIKIAYDAVDDIPPAPSSSSSSSSLSPGTKVMAFYAEDGMYYAAVVRAKTSDGRIVLVFDEYDDEEITLNVDEVCTMADFEAHDGEGEKMEVTASASSTTNATVTQTKGGPSQANHVSLPPPVPLDVLQARLPKSLSKDDDLSAMLMSWYMCGYHTGYYEGRTEEAGDKK